MNGWLPPSGLRWFHRVFPGHMAENYPAFPPSQDSPPSNTHSEYVKGIGKYRQGLP